jgi:DNA-binding transcriptional MerR regulator|tara:strand:- start:1932 stop:2261 length:330 start_codon:yes stop_codon:yes gene_type:complete
MPYKEKKILKKYYTIGEVAEKLELNTSLIRFWESEFEILNPKKNKKGLRKYTEKDIIILEKIYHLLKEKGFTIDGAKKAFKRKKERNSESFQFQLENIKNKLIEIRKKI